MYKINFLMHDTEKLVRIALHRLKVSFVRPDIVLSSRKSVWSSLLYIFSGALILNNSSTFPITILTMEIKNILASAKSLSSPFILHAL